MPPLKNFFREIHRRSIWQVLGIYVVSAWIILQGVDTLAGVLGLPTWAAPFALFLLIVGLPIVLATAFFQSGMREVHRASADEESGAEGGPKPMRSANPGKTLFTWRNALAGGVLALALWGLVSAAWLFLLRPQPLTGEVAVGADVIAVLPFTVSGDAPLTGEGVVDLLSASLDQVGPIRTIPPQTVLARWERAAADGRPDLAASLQIGRLIEAGSVLVGSIVAAGSDVRVDATLHTVSGDLLARTQVSGNAGAPLALVDSLSIALLREIWRSQEPVPNLRVSAISTGDMNAIRAFLEGVAYYRRAEYPAAVDALTRAVTVDSTFALAHLRLAETYGWTASFPSNRAERLRRRTVHTNLATRYADRLPDRERSLATARTLMLEGDRPVIQDSLEAFVQRYPEDAQAWYLVGDVRYHAFEGLLSEPAALMAPFERVVELDPTARTLYSHLLSIIVTHADSAAFGRYLAAMEDIGDADVPDLRILQSALWQSGTPDQAVAEYGRLSSPILPQYFVFALAFRRGHDPREVADALDGLVARSPVDSPFQPFLDIARASLRSALGQAAEAERLRAGLATSPWLAYELAAVPVHAGVVGIDRLLPDPGPTSADPQLRHLWLAFAALESGSIDEARRHIDAGLAQVPEFERLDFETVYDAASGWADMLEGDVAGGLRAMETALSGPSPGAGRDALQGGNAAASILVFRLAAGLAARPDTREMGLRLLSAPWVGAPEYEVLGRFHRARALDAAGDVAGARAAYAWFVDVLADADPELPLQDLVAQARSALEQLAQRGGP